MERCVEHRMERALQGGEVGWWGWLCGTCRLMSRSADELTSDSRPRRAALFRTLAPYLHETQEVGGREGGSEGFTYTRFLGIERERKRTGG